MTADDKLLAAEAARPMPASVIPWPTPEASSRAGVDDYACTATVLQPG